MQLEVLRAQMGPNGEMPLARMVGPDGRVTSNYDVAARLHGLLNKLGLREEADRKKLIQKYIKGCSIIKAGNRCVYKFTLQRSTGPCNTHNIRGMTALEDQLRSIFLPEWQGSQVSSQHAPTGCGPAAAAKARSKADVKPLGVVTPPMKHSNSTQHRHARLARTGEGAPLPAAAALAGAGAVPGPAAVRLDSPATRIPDATGAVTSRAAAIPLATDVKAPLRLPHAAAPAAGAATTASAGVAAAGVVRLKDSSKMLLMADKDPQLLKSDGFWTTLQLVTQREIAQEENEKQQRVNMGQEIALREKTLEHFRDVMKFTGVAQAAVAAPADAAPRVPQLATTRQSLQQLTSAVTSVKEH